MVGETNTEPKQLWTIVLLLKAPVVAWFLISALAKVERVDPTPSFFWLSVPIYACYVAILILPFFWKGSLSCKEITPRLFRRPDGVSIVLAILPLVLWIAVLIFRTAKTDHPFSFLPPWLNKNTLVHYPMLFLSLLTELTALIVVGIIANATKYVDRAKFLLLLVGLSTTIMLVQYFWQIQAMDPKGVEMFSKFGSPWFNILKEAGLATVVFGLMERGKNSVQVIATFLGLTWLLPFLWNMHDIPSMVIGLFGGASAIFATTYFQRTGRWIRWSAGTNVQPLRDL